MSELVNYAKANEEYSRRRKNATNRIVKFSYNDITENKKTVSEEQFPLKGNISDCSNARFPKDYFSDFLSSNTFWNDMLTMEDEACNK